LLPATALEQGFKALVILDHPRVDIKIVEITNKPLILSFFLQVFALRTSKPSGK
jgi:hypothetical protein